MLEQNKIWELFPEDVCLRTSPDVLSYSFGFCPMKEDNRYLHYISSPSNNSSFWEYVNSFDIDPSSRFIDFFRAFSGFSLYNSLFFLFGDNRENDRYVDPKLWRPLSLEFQNIIRNDQEDHHLLIGAISCYEKKFDIYVDRRGMIVLGFDILLRSERAIDFMDFTRRLSSLILSGNMNGQLSDAGLIELEQNIESTFFGV